MTRLLSIRLTEAARSIPVRIGRGALESLPHFVREHFDRHRICVVVDSAVFALHGPALQALFSPLPHFDKFLLVPRGEASKSRRQLAGLQDEVLLDGFGRDTLVVAVGGGVVGDLAGFLAATLFRGLPFIQAPTTLLAQVDASIGGKVGINHPRGKNLLGAFHQPVAIFSDVDLLQTLPQIELVNGLAEVVKIAAVADPALLNDLELHSEALVRRDPDILTAVIARAAELKAQIVADDERESGRRAILNFGHTAGHAIEQLSAYRIKHGFAVAAGMCIALSLSQQKQALESSCRERLHHLLDRLGLTGEYVREFDSAAVWQAIAFDKKKRSGQPRFVLLNDIGSPVVTADVHYDDFAAAWKEQRSHV